MIECLFIEISSRDIQLGHLKSLKDLNSSSYTYSTLGRKKIPIKIKIIIIIPIKVIQSTKN